MASALPAGNIARQLYRHVGKDWVIGFILVPYGRMRQRALRARCPRSDCHTYTSFYRSPPQLDALCGPVLSRLEEKGADPLSILVLAGSNGAEAYTLASEIRARRPDLDFHIKASDLHEHTVRHAEKATYTLNEITQGLPVPEDFLERTFDLVDGLFVVKPEIRALVSFETADLLAPEIVDRFRPADIVFVQNVLFHLPPDMARKAFANVLRLLKPGAFLFIEGMELDMRSELTKAADLVPLDYRVKEIYEYSRRHIPTFWWRHYFGNEPYSRLSSNRIARYSTIFIAPN